MLAERGVDARANLEQVITLTLAVRDAGLTEPGELAMSCLHEAMARVQLAQRAVDVRHHAEEAVRLCERARSLAPGDGHVVGAALLETGNAHQMLGRLAREGTDAVRAAIECYEAALRVLPPDSPEAQGCQANLVQARSLLAGDRMEDRPEALRA